MTVGRRVMHMTAAVAMAGMCMAGMCMAAMSLAVSLTVIVIVSRVVRVRVRRFWHPVIIANCVQPEAIDVSPPGRRDWLRLL